MMLKQNQGSEQKTKFKIDKPTAKPRKKTFKSGLSPSSFKYLSCVLNFNALKNAALSLIKIRFKL